MGNAVYLAFPFLLTKYDSNVTIYVLHKLIVWFNKRENTFGKKCFLSYLFPLLGHVICVAALRGTFSVRLSGRTFLIGGKTHMPDYKEMYRELFVAVTKANEILKEAQIKCEELYIDSSEEDENKVMDFKVIAGEGKK